MNVDWLDSGGGHMLVALFIFLVGVFVVTWNVDLGREIVIGALASLWTALRSSKKR